MTSTASGPYLVTRRDDGYGDVIPLQPGQRFTLGRANSNRIVLKDELASRDHAEVYFAEQRWRLRDLKSLNGTRINDDVLDSEWELSPGDEFQIGKSRFMFVHQLDELPQVPMPSIGDTISIKKRLSSSRFLTPPPDELPEDTSGVPSRHVLSRDLMQLYRLSLEMGSAGTYHELADAVLDGLLSAVKAEVGAILTIKEGREMEITSVRPDGAAKRAYSPVSEFVTHEVMSAREAILAEDVSRNRYLSQRESITQLGATSLICAPVIHQEKVLALIHLYCTDPHKSFSNDDLEFTIAVAKHLAIVMGQMLRQDSLSAENRSLREQLHVESELIGQSPAIKSVLEQIGRVAPTNATVLIRGESGSGKELVARAIHFSSLRREGPFICLNCAAITETLLESELFGHERGAFTGATEKKIGKFEASDHGTIFLDEIGEMAFNTQAKLLRVLEGHPFERVGGSTPIRVDVRVVAATNQPLEQNIREGKFRRDLFYRLQVVDIQVPALRERKSDVPILAEHFLKRFARETGRKMRGFTPAALAKMEQYDWPGNVRELKNVVERAVALARTPMLDLNDILLSSLELPGTAPASGAEPFEAISLEELDKRHIIRTLEHTQWNKSQTAAILGIERSTLDRKIKAYQLKRDE
ncbi:MAG: sigma 54-interacting transcriptional regulator [Planctomycetes bacterium]|nr:sigma 54-interacting transcriptional regulator [Planctomycetota bacterium]